MRSNFPAARFSFFLCGLMAQPCLSAEWSVEPSISLKGQYSDNINLTTLPHSSVWGITLSPDVKFSRKTEISEATGGLKLNFNRYSGNEEGLDSEDVYLIFRSSYRAERNRLGLDIDVTRDPTLVTELAETGAVQARRQRNQVLVSPSWSRLLTERTTIKLDYTYRAVDYDDTVGTTLIDYEEHTGAVALQYSLSERTLLNVATYYDVFETDPARFKATSYGIVAGINHQFSETLRGELSIGARKTESEIASQALVCAGQVLFGLCFGQLTIVTFASEEDSSGYTFNVALEKRSEASAVSGRVSRDIYPTGVGSLIETDAVSASWTNDVSATIRASLAASAYRSRYLGDIVTNSDSRYYTIGPAVNWRVTERWVLDAGYNYSRVKYEDSQAATANTATANTATANTVYVMLSYAWPKIAASR